MTPTAAGKAGRFSPGNLVLAGVSLLLALVVLELVAAMLEPASVYRWHDRLTFLSGGAVIENFPGGFRYAPRQVIGAETFYIDPEDRARIELEFAYTIRTNDLGLVQLRDSVPDKPAVLILGDSYVEGQGAAPWFYLLESDMAAEYPAYQFLNGGIFATGIEQFRNLYAELRDRVTVSKLAVVFISNDWIRAPWQMPERTLACLADWRVCRGDENFYGLPEKGPAREVQVRKIADYRLHGPKPLKERLRPFALVRLVWNAASALIHRDQVARNQAAAAELVDAVGRENTVFIHLPQKDEVLTGISPLGRSMQAYLRGQGYRLVDGFETCGLEPADFHPNDGHPNAAGYDKIRRCIEAALEPLL